MYRGYPEIIVYSLYSFLFTNGIIFIEKVILSLRKSEKSIDWFRLWVSLFLIISGITLFVLSREFIIWGKAFGIIFFSILTFILIGLETEKNIKMTIAITIIVCVKIIKNMELTSALQSLFQQAR